VLADVRTFVDFGLTASAAITSITFQNPSRGFGGIDQTGSAVRAQVTPLLDDFTFVCAKTGMLPTREVVKEVARLFRETALPGPVVDPVIMASSGQRLMEEAAIDALIEELLPLAQLLTPNVPEAETLTGRTITSEADMRLAAATIRAMGVRAVLIKGGHLGEREADGRRQTADGIAEEAIDVLDNDGEVTVFREQRIPGPGIRGSGCILSAAIAAGLGKGLTIENSVRAAKSFVWEALRKSSERV